MSTFDWLLIALLYLGIGNVLLARWMLRHPISRHILRAVLMPYAPMRWSFNWFVAIATWPLHVGAR